MNLYYKMLRMKSRKRTKKMRGGGIFGPVFSSHIDTAGNQASQGWNKFLSGVEVGKKVSRQARMDAKQGYNENIKPSSVTGGVPPSISTTPPLPTTPPSITTSYKPRRPVLYSPKDDAFTLVKKANNPTGTIIGGKRKTKKRRRRRKKKKTKRKKRRRKRKTKKRRRKKYN